MSLETCTEHDDTIVVYERNGYNRAQCPLCEAVQTAEDLVEAIEELQTERDGLTEEIANLKIDLKEAQESQGS